MRAGHAITLSELVATAVGLSLPDKIPAAFGDALLQVRLTGMDRGAMQKWLRARPFAAVLPMQPMLVQPLEEPMCGVSLTFRRKPSSEKGGTDGGLKFAVSYEDEDEAQCGSAGMLLITRNSEGQYTNKFFSERRLMQRILKDLEALPAECGAVSSVVDYAQEQSGGFGQSE